MSKRFIAVVIAVAALLLTGVFLILRNQEGANAVSFTKDPENIRTSGQRTRSTNPASGQLSLKNQTREEAVNESVARLQADRHADWKMPISFYGKVTDERSAPLAGAQVHFQWTDLSAKGTAEKDIKSDDDGHFSLTGVNGKRLIVSVRKDGYYAAPTEATKNFEFADPSEPIYYEPDESHPVVFPLRRKRGAEQLVSKTLDLVMPSGDGSRTVNVSDQSSLDGQLQVSVSKPWPAPPLSPAYDWKLELRMSNGGLIETKEELAFEAPAGGYAQSFVDDMVHSRSDWNVSIDRKLYFVLENPRRYGLLKVVTHGNSRHVHLRYVINPSGSRDLESADTYR